MTPDQWQRLAATVIVATIPSIRSLLKSRAEKARREGRKPVCYRVAYRLGAYWAVHKKALNRTLS
jgi:hypothetical protein